MDKIEHFICHPSSYTRNLLIQL